MNIAMIDADTNRLRTLRTILASLGFKSADTESFSNMKDAKSTFKKKRFNLAILSIDFEKDEAYEMLSYIRSTSMTKDLPVLAMSSKPSRENVLKAHQSGANAFLGHPCSVDDLDQAIKQATNGELRPN